MSTKIKMEPEEEVQPGTSGGDVRLEQQTKTEREMDKEASDSEDTLDSEDEYITQYCEMVDSVQPMTVSKELFYTDSMVARNYEQLSEALRPDEGTRRISQTRDGWVQPD